MAAGDGATGMCMKRDGDPQSDRSRGCVTPQIVENMKDLADNDLDAVDGYDDLPADLQEKIKYAFEHDHIADEDWKGVLMSLYAAVLHLLTVFRMSR